MSCCSSTKRLIRNNTVTIQSSEADRILQAVKHQTKVIGDEHEH